MKTTKVINTFLSLSMVFSLLLGGIIQANAQSRPAAASGVMTAAAGTQTRQMVGDELGANSNSGDMSAMRGTSQAMRQAAASHAAALRTGTKEKYAGVDPATASKSPLAQVTDLFGKVARTIASLLAPQAPGTPDYFGVANYANSPLPTIDPLTGAVSGGMRKFVDTLPGLCALGVNDLGQCIPLAAADTDTFPGSDYYEIALVDYKEQLHKDLPATQLRGYVQLETSVVKGDHYALTYTNGSPILDAAGVQVYGVKKPHYLGPTILATRNRPVRVKFSNYLANGTGGDLIIPMDNTYMGAGMGPSGSLKSIQLTNTGGTGYASAPAVSFTAPPAGGALPVATANILNGKVVSFNIISGGSGYLAVPTVTLTGGGATSAATASAVMDSIIPDESYTPNRATLHLHGGNTPWISDGTPHQWTTPRGELTSYSRGDSVSFVPDMWFDGNGAALPAGSCQGTTTCVVSGATNDPGPGSLSFYWTNQQSGRLMFYHDHAYGITRLNVYAGEAAGYLLVDPAQENALLAANVPGTMGSAFDVTHMIPLILQDKTFVPSPDQLAATDPTWDSTAWGGLGNLWLPHVYMPNQNPYDNSGANPFGRWDYGPWFWPPQQPSALDFPPVDCTSSAYPGVTLTCPGTPNPSGTPEAFMDTPVVNGTAYPSMTVEPTAYRFQMLMAGNDRTWNLGWYVAEPLTVAVTNAGSGYTSAPVVGFTGGGGTGATATAIISGGTVDSFFFTAVGAGYTSAPSVVIAGDGTGASATAVIDNFGHLAGLRLISGGTGYTAATVTIGNPVCSPLGTLTCAAATANVIVAPAGAVIAITVTNPGSGWTSAPAVTLTGGGGTGATAIASINTEVKMVDAAPHNSGSILPACALVNPTGGAQLVARLSKS